MNIALIIAGGIGVRMNSSVPKQFLKLNDKEIIIHTIEKFEKCSSISHIVVVCIENYINTLDSLIRRYKITKVKAIIKGGSCGQESIFNGVNFCYKNFDKSSIILVHDAIRPFVSEDIINNCISITKNFGNAITVDTCTTVVLKKDQDCSSHTIINRDDIVLTQTPQAFVLEKLMKLHNEALLRGIYNSVASCTLMIELGYQVYFSKGDPKNIKITTPEDLEIAKRIINE